MNAASRRFIHAIRDLAVLSASIASAVLIARADAVNVISQMLGGFDILGIFVAGFFFTSIATVAPAGVVLGGYATILSPLLVALVGAAGSVLADLVLFRVTRDHVSRDFRSLLARRGLARLEALARSRLTRYLLPLLGGIIIASPLPDEIGVALLGLSHSSTPRFMAIAYAFNAAGILLLGVAVRALAGG